jgi:hypothetical protein
MTALVVLPGLDGTATLHTEFVTSVGPAFDSVAVIPYPSDKALGYAALESLVRAQLPPATPFVLLGESFSGPIALSIAANPPPNLVGLILSTTFAKAPFLCFRPWLRLHALRQCAPCHRPFYRGFCLVAGLHRSWRRHCKAPYWL